MAKKNANKRKMRKVERGDVLYVDFGKRIDGSVQAGIRPCVVVSNNISSNYSTTLCVCPFTTKIKYNPVHVVIHTDEVQGYLERDSDVLPEQIVTISKNKVLGKIGHINNNSSTMKKINFVLAKQLGLEGYEKEWIEDATEKEGRGKEKVCQV